MVSLADRLSEEEISDLVDVVLCADDVTEFTLEWVSEIYDFRNDGHKLSSKANVIKAFYGKLDEDYTTNTGEYLHITATDEGLDFQVEGQGYSFTYKELAQKIDTLMLMGVYPFSSTENTLDDYAIPNEVEQMQGHHGEHSEDVNTPTPPTKQEVIDKIRCGQGGKERIYKAMLSFPAKKDRVILLQQTYGIGGVSGGLENGGHERINYDGKGFHTEYTHNGLEFDELLSWSAVESRIFEFVKQGKYLTNHR